MLIFRFLILVLVLLTNIEAIADTSGNKDSSRHGAAKNGSEICTDPSSPPTLKCAKTPSAAFDNLGTLWLAWAQGGRVYVQSSTDQGLTFSEAVRVNEEPESVVSHVEARPKIMVAPEGQIYLSWMQSLEKRFSSNIRFSRSTDGGKTFSKPITINDNLDTIGHAFDSLAVGPDGKVFIAWLDARDMVKAMEEKKPFNGSSLYYTWSDDAGAHFKPNTKIIDGTCQCCRLQTEIDLDGNPLVMWRHIFPENIRDHALVKFASWDKPGEINRITHENWQIDACPHHGPGLTIDKKGRYHAVWFSNAPESQGLFYAYSSDSGRTFSTPISFGNPGASHPHVKYSDGRVVVAWSEFDGDHNQVLSMQSLDDGKTWSQPSVLMQTDGGADNPFLINHGGKIFLYWGTEKEGFRLGLVPPQNTELASN